MLAVLRIRDVYPGSDFFPSRIRTVSIPDPGSSSKNLSILTPPKAKKKWFLSSKKYDPGCHPGSRILMLTFSHPGSWIPDPGVKKVPNPGSRIRIRNTECQELILSEIKWQKTIINNASSVFEFFLFTTFIRIHWYTVPPTFQFTVWEDGFDYIVFFFKWEY